MVINAAVYSGEKIAEFYTTKETVKQLVDLSGNPENSNYVKGYEIFIPAGNYPVYPSFLTPSEGINYSIIIHSSNSMTTAVRHKYEIILSK